MKKWEIARYLIDAKKCVDSIWFISENESKLEYIDIRSEIDNIKSQFYIKCCVVLDEYTHLPNINKRDLCNSDDLINRIYYERDKNYAHKDNNYQRRKFSSIYEIFLEMQKELIRVREVCSECIPQVVTLDFVSHDKRLFRQIHQISLEKENEILENKHPFKNLFSMNEELKDYIRFEDTEDYKLLTDEEKEKSYVEMKNGICMNEGIQERQDSCIRINVLFNKNMWCSPNNEIIEKYNKLIEYGLIDEYGVYNGMPSDPILFNRIIKILDE